MKPRVARVSSLAALAVVCACSSSAPRQLPESRGTASSALTAAINPVPCVPDSTQPSGYAKAFSGTTPELYFADAWSQCTPGGAVPLSPKDPMLEAIGGMIATTASKVLPGFFSPQGEAGLWETLRNDPSASCDPTTMQPTGVGASVSGFTPALALDYGQNHVGLQIAIADLEEPEFELCIAQHLRKSVPGAAGGGALFFSDADQRELLEMVRERSQMAMLRFALLGEAFIRQSPDASSPYVNPTTGSASQIWQRLGLLEYFAAETTSGGALTHGAALTSMGQDFAAAVQLHSYATEELGSLFARSRSSHAPRTTTPLSPAEDTWGSGSWFQREMALMFGGDPLAITGANSTTPGAWVNPSGATTPSTLYQFDWPPFEQAPYVSTALDSPQVTELLQLAQQYDDVVLQGNHGGGACNQFDVATTAQQLYVNVEFDLETQCPSAPNSKCTATTTPPRTLRTIPANGAVDDGTWALWDRYKITPEHATTVAEYLNDSLAMLTSNSGCTFDPTDSFVGAAAIGGSDTQNDPMFSIDSATGNGHLMPQATLNYRPIEELAGVYARNTTLTFYTPFDMDESMDAGQFGFFFQCFNAGGLVCKDSKSSPIDLRVDAMRTMGSMEAAAATRDILMATLSTSAARNPATLQNFLAPALQIIDVLTGAVGPSVTVKLNATVLDESPSPSVFVPYVPSGSGAEQWLAYATVDANDPFWIDAETQPSEYALFPVTGPYAADLAEHPETKIGSSTIASVVQTAASASTYLASVPSFVTSINGLKQYLFIYQPPVGDKYSLVVRRTFTPTGGMQQVQYRLLAANLATQSNTSSALAQAIAPTLGGNYLASSGTLGTLITHQAAPSKVNPTWPAYDGFDIPNPWVPPFNAELLGGTSSQTSIDSYISLAQTSAQTAAMAVQTALEGLQQEQVDQATAQAAAVKAVQAVQQDRDALCGAGNTQCNTNVSPRTIPASTYPGFPSSPTCNGSSSEAKLDCRIDTMVFNVVTQLTDSLFYIPDEVYNSISDPAPSFENYAGGSLQTAFIAEWQAIRAPGDKITAVISTAAAAKAQVSAAIAVFNNQQDEAQHACSPEAMADAVLAGTSVNVNFFPPGGGVSFNPGPLMAAIDNCRKLENALDSEQKQEAEALANAFASLSSALVGFTDAVGAIATAGATVQQQAAQAKMNDARANLEASLASTTLTTSSGLFREYRSADVWRAMSLLEGARRYALAARRAIEARYVVNMSTMNQPETFVTSPSTWADEVYEYDLNMPSAVGLSVSGAGSGQTGTIYSNKVTDYVSNLQAFVSGYAASRPAAVDGNEIDVVNLPGLVPPAPQPLVVATDGGTDGAVDGGDGGDAGADGGSGTINFTSAGEWALHCPPDPGTTSPAVWIGAPPAGVDVDHACTVKGVQVPPDEVRLSFVLDPWGRLNSGIASTPFVDRFNAR
ncbi:MAG: hypothetical protein ACRENE_30950, partial [Polyangiaceae bacterium]